MSLSRYPNQGFSCHDYTNPETFFSYHSPWLVGIQPYMGCKNSVISHEKNHNTAQFVTKRNCGQTRIIQEDVVDTLINDEHNATINEQEESTKYFKDAKIQSLEIVGSWKVGVDAGGSRNDLELFSTNPQYLLSLGPRDKHPKNDEFYISDQNLIGTDVYVCLTQTDFSVPLLHVAFFIYKTDNEKERLSAEYFLCMPPEGNTGAFINRRQIKQLFKLPPGLYVIVPAAFSAGLKGTFKLSIKASPPAFIKELTF